MSRIYLLRREDSYLLWQQLEKLLAPIIALEGLYTPAHVLAEHARGEIDIWVSADPVTKVPEAVMVTRMVAYPLKKVCAIPYIAGKNMAAWKDEFLTAVSRHALAKGCSELSGGFRKGWARVAGFEITGVNLKKVLR